MSASRTTAAVTRPRPTARNTLDPEEEGVRLALHLVLYAMAGKRDPDLLGAVLRMTPSATLGPALIDDGVLFGVAYFSVRLPVTCVMAKTKTRSKKSSSGVTRCSSAMTAHATA